MPERCALWLQYPADFAAVTLKPLHSHFCLASLSVSILHTDCIGTFSALAAVGQLSCNFSAWLPCCQSTSNCQLRCTPFSPAAVFQPVCNQLARLESVSTAAQCYILCSSVSITTVQLQSASSAVSCQLSCKLSALVYFVMHLICCDRPAARHQLSFEVQGSSAICHLSCNLSARSHKQLLKRSKTL